MPKTKATKKASSSASSAKHSKPSAGEGKGAKISASMQNVLNWAAKITIEEGKINVPREEILLELKCSKGSFANLLTGLRKEDCIEIFSKHIVVTQKGMAQADTDGVTSSAPQSHEEQQEKLMTKFKLSKSERELVEHLADGSWQDREAVRIALGGKSKGSFANILIKPRRAKILESSGKTIRLTDIMFVKKLGGRPCSDDSN